MKTRKKITFILAVFSIFSFVVFSPALIQAQMEPMGPPGFEQGNPPGPGSGQGQGRYQNRQERRQELEDKIKTVRLLRMIETLDLDQKKAMTLNEILNNYDQKRKTLTQKQHKNMKELRQQLNAEKPQDATIQKTLNNLTNHHKEMAALRTSQWEDIGKHLTPTQQAKFLIFQQEFRRSVRDIFREHRGMRKGNRGPRQGQGNGRPSFQGGQRQGPPPPPDQGF